MTPLQTQDSIYSSGLSDMPSCLTASATCLTASGGVFLSPCSLTLSAIDCTHKTLSKIAQQLYKCRRIIALLQAGAPAAAIGIKAAYGVSTNVDECASQQQRYKP